MQKLRVLFAALVFTAACRVPPPPPTPVGPHVEVFAVKAADGTNLAPVATATLTFDDLTPVATATLQADGQLGFTIPGTAKVGWGAWMHVAAPQRHSVDVRVVIHAVSGLLLQADCGCPSEVTLEGRQLLALRVRGEFFEQVDGTRWTGIETSDFNLLNIYQNLGPAAAEPIAQQRQDLGFNLARVWTLYDAGTGAGDFRNINYAQVGSFLDFMAAHGLYVDLTAYAGNLTFRRDHWDKLCAAVQGHTNVLLSPVNELEAVKANWIDISDFKKCPGVLTSSGSNGSQAWPPTQVSYTPDWLEFHTNDAPEWWRKDGHNAMELADVYRLPVVTNEKTRTDRDGALTHYYDAAQGSVLLNAGDAFHSPEGKTSSLFAGFTLQAAQQHIAGMRSLSLSCQTAGGYVHRSDLEGTTYLRVYQRGTDPTCIARIRF